MNPVKINNSEKEDLLKLFKFIQILPGEFLMGSPETEAGRFSDENQVKVVLTKPFEMLETQVTQLQYFSVMGINPSTYEGMQKPVQNVSWDAAIKFCEILTTLDQAHHYRLPTEAEWEYCCRAGTITPYSYGGGLSGIKDLDQFAHFNSNDGPINVKSLLPNPWGLYDMHGNVWEWCSDCYASSLIGGVNPQGPDARANRVVRGGSWYSNAQNLRSAFRGHDATTTSAGILGFRILRERICKNVDEDMLLKTQLFKKQQEESLKPDEALFVPSEITINGEVLYRKIKK